MQQLDIFADSRDLVLLNTLAEALTCGEIDAAYTAAATLRHEFPDDRHLADAAALIGALQAEQQAGDAPYANDTAALAARHHLENQLKPAALAVLGSDGAGGWMDLRWRALARRAQALPLDSAPAEGHAAALWLQGRDWAAAADAVQGIASWRRKPQPLAWMAQARWNASGPDSAWPLLAELAWMAPHRVPALLTLLPDPKLHKLARGFENFQGTLDVDPGAQAEWDWWPAWLLVEQPLLATALDAAETAAESAPESGFKTVLALLRLERQGRHHDIVALRRQLKALHPELFAAYMATR